jgi:hypothetical protein
MAETAKNALRARGGEGGNAPQRLDGLVKSIQANAKRQQDLAAKELAESKKLGSTISEVLESVKRMKKDFGDILKDQKQVAEETLKKAAESSTRPKQSSPGARRQRTQEDTGSAYDTSSFKQAARNIDGMRGPAGAANDMIDDMRSGFDKVRKSASALGMELYGNSILPEIQKHLQGIIDQLNTIRGEEDLLNATAAASTAGNGGLAGGGMDLNALSNIIKENNAQLIDALAADRDKLSETIIEQNNDIQGALTTGIGALGDKKGEKSSGGGGLENITQAEFQDKVFAAFRKDFLLGIKGGLETFMGLQIPFAVKNIQQLNKEVNNLQGGMAGNVAAAREFRIETTNALQDIRRESGFTIEQIGSASTAVLGLGVSNAEAIAMQTDVMLMGSRALGAEVGDVAQTYGLTARNLRLSVDQTREMISGTLRVAKQTGLTARNVMDIRKETQGFADELRRAGALSAQLTNEITRTQAAANKLGVGNFQQDLQRVFTDISQLGNVPDDLAVITAYARNELTGMGYGINEILTGTMLTTLQGQRDFAKATKNSLILLREQAEAMGSEAGAANYLQNISRGRIKSLEEINRLIQLQTQASETAAEKVDRLKDAERQIMDMRAAGLDDALVGNAIAEITGDTSHKTITDLRKAITDAQGAIATDQEDLAADFMNKLVKRQTQLMAGTDISAMDARDKAFTELSGTIKGELAGMSPAEIQNLAIRSAQRASTEVAESAAAATDNMTDRVAQGVQKGIQMVAGPFADLVDFFDSMGVGPFVAGVATFGTAALMLVSSIKGLNALVGTKGILSRMGGSSGAGDSAINTMFKGGTATSAGPVAAQKAAKAGEQAVAATSTTASTARSVSSYMAAIGDAGQELWKQLPRLMKGLAALTAVGLAIGGSILLMSKVYPPPGETMATAASIGASVVAMGILAGAMLGFQKIGDIAGKAVSGMKGALASLLALTATGVAIGGATRVLAWAFPDADEVVGLATGIAASAVAFTVLAVSLATLIGVGLLLTLLSGPQALAALGAFVLALGVLTTTGLAIGGAMSLLAQVMPNPGEILGVATAIAASAVAFGALAAAFAGLVGVGLLTLLPALMGPLGAAAVAGAIAAGIGVLAGTAVLLSQGINQLHGMFDNPEEIEKTANTVAAAAGAFDSLAAAYLKLVAVGGVMVGLPMIGRALPLVALNSLVGFAGKMNETIGKVQTQFDDITEIEETSKTVQAASGAIGSLGKAYKSVVDAANLSWWKAGLDTFTNTLAVGQLAAFGVGIAPYMRILKATYGNMQDMQEVADKVSASSSAMRALAEAGSALAQYEKDTDGWVSNIKAKDLVGKLEDLTEISVGMSKHLPTIAAHAPDPSDASKISSSMNVMKNVSELMTTILQMQKEFDNPLFGSDPMKDMDIFMADLGGRLADTDGGFHQLLAGIDNMPQFRKDQIEKLDSMNNTIGSVFAILKTLGGINDEIPNKAMFKTDMRDINQTMRDAVGVFSENSDSLMAMRDILSQIPTDLGNKAGALSLAFRSLSHILGSVDHIANEFPSGSRKSLEVMRDHMRYIADNLDGDAIQSLSDAFAGVDLGMPDRIDALAGGFERLPNLLAQVQKFTTRVDRSALQRAHDDIQFIAWALSPLAELANALTFDAPNIEHFEREIANLILTLGSATESIPEVLELRGEIEAQISSRGSIGTAQTLNEALTDGPGAGNTLTTTADVSAAMMDTSTTPGPSMGGSESRLDKLINAQEETNSLMRQLLTALTAPAPRVGQVTSGVAPTKTFPRAGSIRQNVDAAWNSTPELTT